MPKLARSLHLRGRMSPSHSWVAAALGAWLLATPLASAQDAGTTSSAGTINVNAITVGGEDVTLEGVLLGIAECEGDEVILFELDNVPADRSSIDIYLGERCNQTDRNNADTDPCDYLTTLSTDGKTRDLMIEIGAADLFLDGRSEPTGSDPTLWFLAVDNPMSEEDVGAGYGVYGANDELKLDNTRPDPPTDVTGGSGENRITVSWDTDQAMLRGFRVYIDSNPTQGGSDA